MEIPSLDGLIETRFDIRREGDVINIQRQGLTKAWKVLLVGINSVENVQNTETINGSTLIRITDYTNELNIRLK